MTPDKQPEFKKKESEALSKDAIAMMFDITGGPQEGETLLVTRDGKTEKIHITKNEGGKIFFAMGNDSTVEPISMTLGKAKEFLSRDGVSVAFEGTEDEISAETKTDNDEEVSTVGTETIEVVGLSEQEEKLYAKVLERMEELKVEIEILEEEVAGMPDDTEETKEGTIISVDDIPEVANLKEYAKKGLMKENLSEFDINYYNTIINDPLTHYKERLALHEELIQSEASKFDRDSRREKIEEAKRVIAQIEKLQPKTQETVDEAESPIKIDMENLPQKTQDFVNLLGQDNVEASMNATHDLPKDEKEELFNEEPEVESFTNIEKGEGPLGVKDIPTFMYGDSGGGYVFEKQTDLEANTLAHYIQNGEDKRDHFVKKPGEKSDAEIIKKEKLIERIEKIYGKKPLLGNDKWRESRADLKEDKKYFYDVLNIYLLAEGPRGPSATTIGIKIPEGINPSPFMKELAKKVSEADKEIGALFISKARLNEIGGWPEFNKRQDELKKVAQELFLRYANEQLTNKDKK